MGSGFSKKTCRHHIKNLEQKTEVQARKLKPGQREGFLDSAITG